MYHIKAWVEYKAKDFSTALESLEKAIELDPYLLDAHILMADILISQVEQRVNENGILKDAHYNSLQKSLKHLSKAIDLLDEEQKDKLANTISKRGTIYNWLGDFQNSRSDFEEANTIMPNNPVILKDLTLSCWALDEYQVALDYIQELKRLTPEDSELELIVSEIYMDKGESQQAIQILEKAIACQDANSPDLRFHALLIKAYDQDFQTSTAEKKLAEFEQQYGLKPEIVLAKAKHLKLLGDFSAAVEKLESALERTSGKLKIKFKILLADILYGMDDLSNYKRAAELYGSIASIFVVDRVLEGYASSLYCSRQFAKCLELCKDIQQIHGFIDFFSELEAAIYFNSNNFYPASEILKVLAQKNPKNIHRLINYGVCLFRLGKRDAAFDAILQAERKIEDSAQDMAFISTAYASVGKIEESLELAWQALKKDPDDPDLHIHYIFLFLRAENYISDFDKKYIKTYQDCMENFNERFPDEKAFFKQKVPNNPEEFRQKILELLENQSNPRQNAEKLYYDNRLPIGFLAKVAGKSIIRTWAAVTAHPLLKVWASSGNPDELQREINCAAEANTIVSDLIAILTLKELKLLKTLIKAYDDIIVCQSILDEFQKLIAIQEISVQKGHMTIWAEDGKIYRQEIPAKTIKKDIDTLKEIVEFLSENEKIKIVGKSIERLKNKGKYRNIAEVLGSEPTETLLESSSRSLPMYAEDWWLRHFGKVELNIEGFGTRALLDVFLKQDLITKEKYHNCLIDLLSLNYHFISIHPETLTIAVEATSFYPKERSLIAFNSLRHRDNNEQNLINLAIVFLKWLWLENIPVEYKEQWTDIILNVITFNRNKRHIINQINNRKTEIFSPLVRHIEQQFNSTLRAWVKSQLII